jgi:hypothetical protein
MAGTVHVTSARSHRLRRSGHQRNQRVLEGRAIQCNREGFPDEDVTFCRRICSRKGHAGNIDASFRRKH